MKIKEIKEKFEKSDYNLNSITEDELLLIDRYETLIKHKGKLVRHFKNKYYMIVDIATHTETGEELVIYKAMYGENKIYARPLDMFLSKVDKVKYPNVKDTHRMNFITFG